VRLAAWPGGSTVNTADHDGGDLRPITPRDAVERFLERRESDSTEQTLRTYHDRLHRFVRWLEHENVLNLNEVSGRDLQEFLAHRQETCNRTTLNNEFGTLKKFFEFLVAIEATEPAMPDRVHLLKPSATADEQTNREKLPPERATEILEHLERFEYASRQHVTMLLMWRFAFRISDLRAIDVDDCSFDGEIDEERLRMIGERAENVPKEIGPHLYMIHRPESGTPLKNKAKSERIVSLTEDEVQVLQDYIRTKRNNCTDENGRRPLVTSTQGRPTGTAVRRWMYRLTHPCLIGPCPHDKDPNDCEYLQHGHESGCPSVKSPHKVRTGAISNMRECGIAPEDVSERVDATPETIRQHYDFSDELQRLENRRESFEELE
jgi:site-specific recombinase XerD